MDSSVRINENKTECSEYKSVDLDGEQLESRDERWLTLTFRKDYLLLLQQKDKPLAEIRDEGRTDPPKRDTKYFISEGLTYRQHYKQNESRPYVDIWLWLRNVGMMF